MMGAEWYYAVSGKQAGPVTQEQLASLAASRQVGPDDLVWTKGMPQWAKAGTVAGLLPAIQVVGKCPNCGAIGTAAHSQCSACDNWLPVQQGTGADWVDYRWATGNQPQPELGTLPPAGLAGPQPLSADEINIVRSRLTAHADAIPCFHEANRRLLNAFGAKVHITEAVHIPVYLVQVQTLYERRELLRKDTPHTGQDVPPHTNVEGHADIWNRPLPRQEAFVAKHDEHVLEGSQVISNCPACSASGSVVCPECQGKAIIDCPACDAEGTHLCGNCAGTGRLQGRKWVGQRTLSCPACGGRGFRRATLADSAWNQISDSRIDRTCSTCNGQEVVGEDVYEDYAYACPDCDNGRVTCDTCSGSGHVSCRGCDESGSVSCEECQGQGRMLSYLVIAQSFTASKASQLATPIPVEEVISKRLPSSDCRPLVVLSTVRLPADSESISELRTGIEAVDDQVRRQITNALPTSGDGCRITKQELIIAEASLVKMSYLAGGRDHIAWLIGQAKTVYGRSSPFTDYVQTLLGQVQKMTQEREYAAAGVCLRQCRDIARSDFGCADVLAAAESSIPSQVKDAAALSSRQVASAVGTIVAEGRVPEPSGGPERAGPVASPSPVNELAAVLPSSLAKQQDLLAWLKDVYARALAAKGDVVGPNLTAPFGMNFLAHTMFGRSTVVSKPDDEEAFTEAVKIMGGPVKPKPVQGGVFSKLKAVFANKERAEKMATIEAAIARLETSISVARSGSGQTASADKPDEAPWVDRPPMSSSADRSVSHQADHAALPAQVAYAFSIFLDMWHKWSQQGGEGRKGGNLEGLTVPMMALRRRLNEIAGVSGTPVGKAKNDAAPKLAIPVNVARTFNEFMELWDEWGRQGGESGKGGEFEGLAEPLKELQRTLSGLE